MSKNNQVENGFKKCQETFNQNQIKLQLNFRDNQIGVKKAAKLGDLFSNLNNLTTLDLKFQDNQIGAEGVAKLSESISKLTNLITLNLDF